LAFTVSSLLVK